VGKIKKSFNFGSENRVVAPGSRGKERGGGVKGSRGDQCLRLKDRRLQKYVRRVFIRAARNIQTRVNPLNWQGSGERKKSARSTQVRKVRSWGGIRRKA